MAGVLSDKDAGLAGLHVHLAAAAAQFGDDHLAVFKVLVQLPHVEAVAGGRGDGDKGDGRRQVVQALVRKLRRGAARFAGKQAGADAAKAVERDQPGDDQGQVAAGDARAGGALPPRRPAPTRRACARR